MGIVHVKQNIFTECKRPRTKPDKQTFDIKNELSSEYWYQKKDGIIYTIRSSDHWARMAAYNTENYLLLKNSSRPKNQVYVGQCSADSAYEFTLSFKDGGICETLYLSKLVTVEKPRDFESIRFHMDRKDFAFTNCHKLRYALWLVFFGIDNKDIYINKNKQKNRKRNFFCLRIEERNLVVYDARYPHDYVSVVTIKDRNYLSKSSEIIVALEFSRWRDEKYFNIEE